MKMKKHNSQIKNWIDGFYSREDPGEDRVSELDDRSVELTARENGEAGGRILENPE